MDNIGACPYFVNRASRWPGLSILLFSLSAVKAAFSAGKSLRIERSEWMPRGFRYLVVIMGRAGRCYAACLFLASR